VTEAAEQWLAERVNTTHRRAFIIEGYIRRAVLPVLGSYRLRDVMPAEIGKMVRDYRDEAGKTSRAKTSGRSAARALLATCEGLFAHAVANGWIDSSPAEQLTAAIVGPSDGSRDRGAGRRGNPVCHAVGDASWPNVAVPAGNGPAARRGV
jgi:hypothetical protein